MTSATGRMEHAGTADLARTLDGLGEKIIRYGMVAILLWVGALKFAAYEAESIQGLVANSPLMSWGYSVMSVRGFAALIGVIEIALGLLIATRPFAPKLSAIGSLGVIGMALITLTFVLTTPGVWQPGYGFPYLSMTGAFLAKDLLLLGAAVWTAGEALRAAGTPSPSTRQAGIV
ncbi:MAG: DUF417 family protein [Gemmatimonadota bacterium]|nr:DUF417 family protein [Gemmatimonadota bacterium]